MPTAVVAGHVAVGDEETGVDLQTGVTQTQSGPRERRSVNGSTSWSDHGPVGNPQVC